MPATDPTSESPTLLIANLESGRGATIPGEVEVEVAAAPLEVAVPVKSVLVALALSNDTSAGSGDRRSRSGIGIGVAPDLAGLGGFDEAFSQGADRLAFGEAVVVAVVVLDHGSRRLAAIE